MPVIIIPKRNQDVIVPKKVEVNSAEGEPQTGIRVPTNLVKHTSPSFFWEATYVKQSMIAGVVRPSVLNSNECREIILEAKEAGMARSRVLRNGVEVQSRARTCTSAWLPQTPMNSWMYKKVIEATAAINSGNYGFEINGIQSLQVLRYEPLQRFGWHYDTYPDSGRKITAVINLSDPSTYVGGGLRLLGDLFNKQYVREQGAGTWFPSCLHHCAKAPWWGERWVLVAWFLGGNFK